MRHLQALLAVFSLGYAVHANAAVVTFEAFPEGAPITTQIPGLVISAAMGGNALISVASEPINPDEPNGLYNDAPGEFARGFEFALIIDFLTQGNTIGAVVDFGIAGTGVQLVAYDGPNGTGNVLGTASTTTEMFIGINAPGIKSAVFSQAGDITASWLIDDLTYNVVVPAPPALVLFVSALLSAGLRRRAR